MKSKLWTYGLGLGVLTGVVFGILVHIVFFSGTTATTLVKMGRVNIQSNIIGLTSEASEIQPIGSYLERTRSMNFAQEIARKLNRPDLEYDLIPWANGGLGRLNSRLNREALAIEFRVRLSDRNDAVAVSTAAADELVELQNAVIRPLVAALEKHLTDLEQIEVNEYQRVEKFSALLSESMIKEAPLQDRIFVFASYQASIKNWDDTRRLIAAVRLSLARFEIDRPQVLISTHIVRSAFSAPWKTILIGAIAGLIGAFLAIQFYIQFWLNPPESGEIEVQLGRVDIKLKKTRESESLAYHATDSTPQ